MQNRIFDLNCVVLIIIGNQTVIEITLIDC